MITNTLEGAVIATAVAALLGTVVATSARAADTAKTVKHVADRVARVQDRPARRILLENASSYLTWSGPDMSEWLSLSDRVLFQMHLGLCRDCRVYVQQVRLTVGALGALEPPEPSAEVAAELLERFRAWKRK